MEFSAGRYTKDQNTPLMALVPVAPKLEVEDRDAEIEGTSQESTEETEPEMTLLKPFLWFSVFQDARYMLEHMLKVPRVVKRSLVHILF